MSEATAHEGFQRIARSALRAYELKVRDVALVASDWNHTFRVVDDDGASYALRIYLPERRTDGEIGAELGWLTSLADAGFRVPRPVETTDGSAFVRIEDAAPAGSRRAALFTWIAGEPLGDDPTRSSVVTLGAEIARLHEHGRTFSSTERLGRWDTPFPHGERSLLDGSNADVVEGVSSAVFGRAMRAADRAIERLRGEEPPRIVHCDLHQDNVLIDGDEVALIDFDDCVLGWPVQDLGVTMWEVGEDETTWPYREALRAGYERVAPWPERGPGAIDAFAANRGLLKADDLVRQRVGRDDEEVREAVRRHARAIDWFLGNHGRPHDMGSAR